MPSIHVMLVPPGIDPTGAQDVTAELNAFLESVPDDTLVRLGRNARYRIEGTVQLVDKHRVVIGGNHALLFATTSGDRERAHLSVVGGSDITIRNLQIRGAHPDGGTGDGAYVAEREAQHGIQLHGPERVRIRHVTITDVYGDFVYIGRDLRRQLSSYAQSSRDITVTDSVFSRNGRQGIAVTQASRVLIARNDVSEVRRTTFDLEPNGPSWLVEDVSIEDNQVGTGRLNFLSAAGRGPVNNIRVSGNQLTEHAMNAMIIDRDGASRRNWSFIGNESDRPFGSPLIGAVVGYGLQGVAFQDNVQPMQPGRNMVGIRLERSCGAIVDGNVLVNAVAQSMGEGVACADSTAITEPAPPVPASLPQPRL